MENEGEGRLVAVSTKFHREAVKPGGVGRSAAKMAAFRSVADLKTQVEQRLAEATGPLIATLQDWPGVGIETACAQAAAVRDLAGLADRHLLTEVAMHTFDSLDAVMADGATMSRAEAVCFADALHFAQGQQGADLTPFQPLLADLEALTTHVIERNRAAQKSA
jgi:hypothetical protein